MGVLFLFLTHLGAGVAFTFPLVGRTAGVKFFRFNAGLAAILLGFGLVFRPTTAPQPFFHALSIVGFGLSLAALVIYWATVGRMLASIRPLLLIIAITGASVGVVAQGFEVPATSGLTRVLTVISFLTSAGFLGGACTAMILGHWYLVLPSMDVALLQSLVKFHIGSIVVRLAVVGAAVFLAIATWQPGAGINFQRYVLSTDGIFFWQRVLFGLAGPAVLSHLTWETAKIRSTQSATGILYVDFFAVVVGEVLAKYLVLSTSVPV